MGKHAYSVYIDTLDYIKGLECLYYSWERTESKHDFVILKTCDLDSNLILPDVQDDRVHIIEIPKYFIGYSLFKFALNKREASNLDEFSNWYKQYTSTLGQFYAFNLVQYDSVLNIHTDMLLMSNLDYLFDKYNEDNTFYVSCVSEQHLDIDVPYNKIFTIDCNFWLIKPDPSFFEYLSTNYALLVSAQNANDIAERFIYPHLDIKELPYDDSYKYIFHCVGPWKYWNVYPDLDPKSMRKVGTIDFISRQRYLHTTGDTIKTGGLKLLEDAEKNIQDTEEE